jgi:hypothetical protein
MTTDVPVFDIFDPTLSGVVRAVFPIVESRDRSGLIPK